MNATAWFAQWAVIEGTPVNRVARLHRVPVDVLMTNLDAAWSALDTAARAGYGRSHGSVDTQKSPAMPLGT